MYWLFFFDVVSNKGLLIILVLVFDNGVDDEVLGWLGGCGGYGGYVELFWSVLGVV